MKKYLRERIFHILFFILIIVCGSLPVFMSICTFIYGEIIDAIFSFIVFALPVFVLLGLTIWVFVLDYKTYIEETKEE